MSRSTKNKLQNLLIVLLSVSAALLFLQSRRLTRGDVLSRLFAPPDTALSDSAAPAETAALPLRFAAVGDYAAYGAPGMTTADEAFSAPGSLLREALGSADGRQAVESSALLDALGGTALYYDFLSPLPASLLGRHLDCGTPAGMESLRRALLCVQEGAVTLYTSDGQQSFRYRTKVSVPDLTEQVNRCELPAVRFAAQLSQAEGLDPWSLLPAEEDFDPPLLSAATCSAESALWSLLGFNPRTNNYYLESDGTQVILEGDSTLRLRPGGVIRYEGSGLSLSDQPFSDAGEAAEAAGCFLSSLLQSCGSSAGLTLRQVSAGEDGWTVDFDYHIGGYPIRRGDGSRMATLTFRGTEVRSLELTLRRFTAGEEGSSLLPLTQALAIARRYAGAEVCIGYLDGGGETLSAGWLAE